MPVLLLGLGVFAVIAGLVMIGFGIPINEFSFGNTLISAGTTATVGGLVIIAIGVAVGHLRRIAGMLATAGPGQPRLALPADDLESAAPARKPSTTAPVPAPPHTFAPNRAGQPPRAKERSTERSVERPPADPFAFEPEPGAPMAGEHPEPSFAPSLRNPDEAPVAPDDDISLSPRHPQPAPTSGGLTSGALDRNSDSFDWRAPQNTPQGASHGGQPPRPQPANFDAMWPDGKPDAKAGKGALAGSPTAAAGPAVNIPRATPREATRETTREATREASSAEPKSDAIARDLAAKPRTVAVLKSGVVDGMGYTLYVDGSIEAELPQGTLRFASINELRSHLEKNS